MSLPFLNKFGHKKNQQRLDAYLLLLTTTIFWGAGLVIVKPALEITTPFRFLLYRYLGAVVLSLPILFHFLPKIKHLKKHLLTIILLELIGTGITLALLYSGLKFTTAIEANLIGTTSPIFISILGFLLLKEKIEKYELFGLSLSFMGTLYLALFPLLAGRTHINGVSLVGNLLIFSQNITVAIYYILAKKYYRKIPKFFVTTVSFYVGLITFFLLSLYETNSLSNLWQLVQHDLEYSSVLFAGGYMALFGSIIALSTYIKGQDKIEASEAALFNYLQPLIYLPLGLLWLGETVHSWQLFSLAIILLGVFVAEKRR